MVAGNKNARIATQRKIRKKRRGGRRNNNENLLITEINVGSVIFLPRIQYNRTGNVRTT